VVAVAPVSDARAAVLAAIRDALGPVPAVPEVPRAYRAGTDAGRGEVVDLFCTRVAEYRATVHRTAASDVEATLSAVCRARGTSRMVVAPGVPWAVDGVEAVTDEPRLTARQLDEVDGVLTGCALAIAETGTFVLDGSGICGRRALTLIPDHHICVVREDQIVGGVPEAMTALRPAAAEGRPITFVSGPSATSDIELQRVEGVHGPRLLDVVVVA
jgi:L-lactate dehydrogenase complex protein LldG